MLGPVAYVEIEVPPQGSAGTGLETPVSNEGWGFVLRGRATLHGANGREFPAGAAFHVPADDGHWFSAVGGTVIAGFAPVAPDLDATDAALRRQGFEVMYDARVPPKREPMAIRAVGPSRVFRVAGAIEVETALMGEWVFMHMTYGPMSGYTSGWCDLPHWGLVLSGDLALHEEDGFELLTAGDVYYCPAGPPGHQFQVPDAAATIDYTPLDGFDAERRVVEWRRSALVRIEDLRTKPPAQPARAEVGAAEAKAEETSALADDPSARSSLRPAAAPAALTNLGPLVPGRLAAAGAAPGDARLGLRWVRGSGGLRGRRPNP
jgi:quercetin dioxygenase-like cupin family protein